MVEPATAARPLPHLPPNSASALCTRVHCLCRRALTWQAFYLLPFLTSCACIPNWAALISMAGAGRRASGTTSSELGAAHFLGGAHSIALQALLQPQCSTAPLWGSLSAWDSLPGTWYPPASVPGAGAQCPAPYPPTLCRQRRNTLQVAILGQLQKPPAGFEEAVRWGEDRQQDRGA